MAFTKLFNKACEHSLEIIGCLVVVALLLFAIFG